MLGQAESLGTLRLVSAHLDEISIELLREAADHIKSKMGSGIVILASSAGDKPIFVVGITSDLTKKGYNAVNIIREVTRVTGGGGGGKPGMATGGGKDMSSIQKALDAARNFIKER